MCDCLNLDVEPPAKMLELTIPAIKDFVHDPGDWGKFDALDWMMRTLSAKWGSYAAARRVNACREESGADHDEIVDLLG